jgi:peptide-methionine (R)-S-oxide reductase
MFTMYALIIISCCYMGILNVQGFQARATLLPLKQQSQQSFPHGSIGATARFSVPKVQKTQAEWKELLPPDAYNVLREEGTEPSNSSELNDVNEPGTFSCKGCGSPLFMTSTKFDSGTGWPSFYAPVDADAIELKTDFKMILPRTECRCASCEGHLGHVFEDGPEPTGQRYCMNGVSMKFASDAQDPNLAATVAERQAAAPDFKPSAGQVLPSAVFNAVIGGSFFVSFASRMESLGGLSSPLDLFPLLPAVYYGVMAARAIQRLL